MNTTDEKRLNFSIPTRSIWSVIILIGLVWFTYIQTVWYFVPSFKIICNLQTSDMSMIYLPLFWAPLILCLLIFLIFLFFIRIFKSLKALNGWKGGLFEGITITTALILFISIIVSLIKSHSGDLPNIVRGYMFCILFGFLIGCIIGTIKELLPKKQ